MSVDIALTVLLALELAWWFYRYRQQKKPSDTSSSVSHIPNQTEWQHTTKPIENTLLTDLVSQRLDLLLRSPYSLSSADKAYLDPILSAADTQSVDTRRKITHLQNELEYLRTTLTFLDTKRHQLRSLYAPIRKLAPEILSFIFSLCIEEIDLHDKSLPGTLCAINRVSKHWRRISQSTPQIWSALSLHWDSSVLSSPAVARRLRYALQRSGDIPIALRLHVYSAAKQGTWKQFSGYVSILPKGRLRTLSLRMEGANVAGTSRVLENMKPVLGGVKVLELDLGDMHMLGTGTGTGTETNLLKKIDKACPGLVSFQWNAPFYASSLGHAEFLKGLTRLDVTLPIDVVPEALEVCGDTLVEMRVRAVVDHETFFVRDGDADEDLGLDEHLEEDDDPELEGRRVLGSLRTLEVSLEVKDGCQCRDQGIALAKILEKISTPNLRVLDVGLDRGVMPRCGCAVVAVMRLLLRMDEMQREGVESLRLRRLPFDDEDEELLDMLRAVPGLRELVVEEMEGFRIVSERFLAGMKGLMVMPNLRRLDLFVLADWKKGIFEDMLRSRERLREIKLRIGSKAERLNVNKLKRMELEVMKVVHNLGSRGVGRGQWLIGSQ